MFYIESSRIKLLPLSNYYLLLWKNSRADMEKELGLEISNQLIDEFHLSEIKDALINFWIPNTAENPENYIWFTNWEIILKENNTSIGGIGLIGLPNEKKETMIGYGIDRNYYNKGFATEAIKCLCEWVFLNSDTSSIIADTKPDNISSQKVLIKNGFKMTGMDEMMHFKLER